MPSFVPASYRDMVATSLVGCARNELAPGDQFPAENNADQFAVSRAVVGGGNRETQGGRLRRDAAGAGRLRLRQAGYGSFRLHGMRFLPHAMPCNVFELRYVVELGCAGWPRSVAPPPISWPCSCRWRAYERRARAACKARADDDAFHRAVRRGDA